jgi:hypothetical protein
MGRSILCQPPNSADTPPRDLTLALPKTSRYGFVLFSPLRKNHNCAQKASKKKKIRVNPKLQIFLGF